MTQIVALPCFQEPSLMMQADSYTASCLPAEEMLTPTLMLRLGRRVASSLGPSHAHSARWELTLRTVALGTLGPSACAALSRAAAGQRVSCMPLQRCSQVLARRPRLQVGAAAWLALSWLPLPLHTALSLAPGLSPSTAAWSLACTEPHCKPRSNWQQPPSSGRPAACQRQPRRA